MLPRNLNIAENQSHFTNNRQVYVRNVNAPMPSVPNNSYGNIMPMNNPPPYQSCNNIHQFNNPPVMNPEIPQQYTCPPVAQQNYNYQNMQYNSNPNYNQGQYVENQRYQHPTQVSYQQPQGPVYNQNYNPPNVTHVPQQQQQQMNTFQHQQVRAKQFKPNFQNNDRNWPHLQNHVSPIKRKIDNTIHDLRKKNRPLGIDNLHQVPVVEVIKVFCL